MKMMRPPVPELEPAWEEQTFSFFQSLKQMTELTLFSLALVILRRFGQFWQRGLERIP
jgi:hypothetical protein